MNYIQTEIDGVWIIEPRVFNDARGYFMEAYRTTSLNLLSVYYADCIIRKANTVRPNWYVS